MEENLPTYQIIKETPKLLTMLYVDCTQPSVKKLGKALETVFELSETILLPIKLLSEKAKVNFQKKLTRYKEKLEKIEDEKIIDVPTIIGTPIIDRLTYVTNDEIAELFINLLAKASSSDTINETHPAFIHMIDRMSIDEARLINNFGNTEFIPFININARAINGLNGFTKLAWNLTGLEFDNELLCAKNIDTYIDNLASLNIIESQGKTYKTDDYFYKKLEKKYTDIISEYNQWASGNIKYKPICEIEKGYFEITELGKSFIKACIK